MQRLFVPFAFLGALAAQESKPADYKAMLQKALVIEKHEQDPKRAIDLLAQVAALAPDEATRKRAEAERERIQDALESSAKDAKNRIGNALDRLRRDDEATWKNGIADLIFAGDACVAELARQVEGENTDRLFITRAVQALVEIGTERAAATLERIVAKGDEFQRKAALLGAAQAQKVSENMRKALGAFVNAHDYKLTLEALDALFGKLSREALLRKLDERELGDASEEVREAAGRALVQVYHHTWWDQGWQREQQRVIAILGKLIADHEAFAARTAVELPFSGSPEGRALQLAALAAFPEEVRKIQNLRLGSQPSAEDEAVELCLAAARALKGSPVGAQLRPALITVIDGLKTRWTRASLPAAVECIELGCDNGRLSDFVASVAQQEDVELVVRAMRASASQSSLWHWLAEHDLPPRLVAAVREHFERMLSPKSVPGADLLIALVRARDPEVIPWIQKLVAERPGTCWEPAAHALLRASQAPVRPEIQDALEVMLTAPAGQPSDPASTSFYRNLLFGRLVQLGSKRAVEGFAKAYELGLRHSSRFVPGPELYARSGGQYRGLAWLASPAQADPGPHPHTVGYDGATSARIFEVVLKQNHPDAWTDVLQCVAQLERFPDVVVEKLAELSLDAPERLANGQRIRGAMLPELIRRLLTARSARLWWYLQELARRGQPDLVRGYVQGLDPMPAEAKPVLETLLESPECIPVALEGLTKLGATDTFERAVKLLASEREQVRLGALYTLVNLDKPRARREIGVLAGDKAWNVRKAFADQAGVLGDQAFVPDLLRLLRDDSQSVRDAAKASLDRIRFLVEQDTFWTKLKKQGGIDAPSAAEALLTKAKNGQPKATRLMAIDSLGTLGVAETLPFLIELCADADQQIAEHAAAAVKRINAR